MPDEEFRPKKKMSPAFRLVSDLGPLAAFFVAYALADFFMATAIFMATLFTSIVISYVITKHIPAISIISGVIVAVFGGLTLFFHDETFFRMKPTIIYLLFAILLLGGLLVGKPLLATVLGEAVDLTDEGWRILSLRWGLFFILLAALNELVRTFFSDYWVYFKVFGTTAFTFIFAMLQAPTMMKHERRFNEEDQG
jgi:intracellular septation protein